MSGKRSVFGMLANGTVELKAAIVAAGSMPVGENGGAPEWAADALASDARIEEIILKGREGLIASFRRLPGVELEKGTDWKACALEAMEGLRRSAPEVREEERERLLFAFRECLDALRALRAHYDDIAKSNPGFLKGLCLQDYALLGTAAAMSASVLRRNAGVDTGTPDPTQGAYGKQVPG